MIDAICCCNHPRSMHRHGGTGACTDFAVGVAISQCLCGGFLSMVPEDDEPDEPRPKKRRGRPPGTPKTMVHIRVENDLLERVEALMKELHRDRSSIVNEILRNGWFNG